MRPRLPFKQVLFSSFNETTYMACTQAQGCWSPPADTPPATRAPPPPAPFPSWTPTIPVVTVTTPPSANQPPASQPAAPGFGAPNGPITIITPAPPPPPATSDPAKTLTTVQKHTWLPCPGQPAYKWASRPGGPEQLCLAGIPMTHSAMLNPPMANPAKASGSRMRLSKGGYMIFLIFLVPQILFGHFEVG